MTAVTMLRLKATAQSRTTRRDVCDTLDGQPVVVPGTDAALITPSLAASLVSFVDQRKVLVAWIEGCRRPAPHSQVLTSIPGIGVRTPARILIEGGDGTLAANAGLAPATPGTYIRSEQWQTGSSKEPSASPLSHLVPAGLTRVQERREGKHHVAAVICLVQSRVEVLFAMLRGGTFYLPPDDGGVDLDEPVDVTGRIGPILVCWRAQTRSRLGIAAMSGAVGAQ
ncbi:hypothetical protein ACF08N_37260 [Streptomyces sp. NPDC015127]|uniref:hypothetical protein n=1 Tax=Streptomyces sp. NPDC015127 TaxID=3364939 RepID=UPI003702AB4D